MNHLMNKVIIIVFIVTLCFLSMNSCSFIGAIGAASGPRFTRITTDSTKALIYVYKPRAYGRAEWIVRYNGETFAKIKKGGYFPLVVNAGRVKFTYDVYQGSVFLGSGLPLDFEAKAGQTYYVRVAGGFSLSINLELRPFEAAIKDLTKCVLMDTVISTRMQEYEETILLSNFNGSTTIRKGSNLNPPPIEGAAFWRQVRLDSTTARATTEEEKKRTADLFLRWRLRDIEKSKTVPEPFSWDKPPHPVNLLRYALYCRDGKPFDDAFPTCVLFMTLTKDGWEYRIKRKE